MLNKLFNGRIGRKDFILVQLTIGIFLGIAAALAAAFLRGYSQETREIVGYIFLAVLLLTYLWLLILRFHDLNLSGVTVLCLLVPILNIWLSFVLLFKKGTFGPNKYGGDPC